MAHDIKALVVDDDDHVRTFLVVLLRKIVSGSVFEARNGQEALEVFERENPELILLDVNMPILDGLQTLAKIRETRPDLPVIMITSLAMRKVVDDALRAGASNFIRKDTPKGQMIEIIRETIVTCLYPESADEQAGAASESAPN
jgi:CheY-like chemotaxis protein